MPKDRTQCREEQLRLAESDPRITASSATIIGAAAAAFRSPPARTASLRVRGEAAPP
jgi:hypothetical protein